MLKTLETKSITTTTTTTTSSPPAAAAVTAAVTEGSGSHSLQNSLHNSSSVIPLPRPSVTTTTDHNSSLASAYAPGTTRPRSPTLRGGLSTSVSKSLSPVRLRSEHSLLTHPNTISTATGAMTGGSGSYHSNSTADVLPWSSTDPTAESDLVLPFESSFSHNTITHSSTSSVSSSSSSFLKRGASFGFQALKAMVSEVCSDLPISSYLISYVSVFVCL